MYHMIDPVVADAAAEGFHATLAATVAVSPDTYVKVGDSGTRLLYTAMPVPTLNTVSPGVEPDLAEVEQFAKELSATGLPWSFQLRREAGPALLELAARYGKTSAFSLPLLRWDAGLLPTLPTALPDGATVREVPGSEREKLAVVLADAFERPIETTRELAGTPEMLDAPDITAFVLEVDGTAVAVGLNIVAGDYVGLFNGGVSPQHRRKGYYRALVAARLRHAVAAGARYAVTMNTPASQPLYESFGFQPVETWTYLLDGS